MITRIVRMHFTEQGVELFQELFKKHKEAMLSVDGCLRLELFNDADQPQRFATISQWKSDQHLEAYRNSTLFKTIWKKIKPYFSTKAEAFSLMAIE